MSGHLFRLKYRTAFGVLQGIMEAVTFMLKSGHKPKRTFYIGFGHDEEVCGYVCICHY